MRNDADTGEGSLESRGRREGGAGQRGKRKLKDEGSLVKNVEAEEGLDLEDTVLGVEEELMESLEGLHFIPVGVVRAQIAI